MLDEGRKPIELGRGPMGITYKALDVDLRCPVTLKVINERYLVDEAAQLRFLREAGAAASVRHPNVASVFHLGRTGQDYFYAMEFVEWGGLSRRRRRISSGGIKTRNADLETKRHNCRSFGFAHSRASFSEYGNHFPVGVGNGQRKLDEFEKLIRDAIALLIERGEIKSPPKRPPPDPLGKTQRSSLDKDPRE
jgi:hypothetical protein